jgi:hypothetical protein
MMSVEIASLRIEIDATDAKTAKVSLDDLTKSGATLEQQAGKLSRSQRDVGVSHGLAGTAAGQAEKSMRALAAVYGDARDSLGRFTKVDGSFRASQEATALMMIRNAQAAATLARQQEQAAKAVAKADADAARVRESAWRQSQAVEAEVMRERVQLARAAEAAEAQAAATTASYTAKVASLKAQLDPFAAVQLKLAQNTRLLDEALTHGAITADQHATALSQVTRAALADVQAINGLHGANTVAGGSMKTLQQLSLNTGRQLTDMGVQISGGQSFGLILIQQLPQIIDGFQVAKLQGLGFKAALAGMAAEAVPLIALFGPWVAGLAAVGAGVFYLVNQHNKQAKAIKDLNAELVKQRQELESISPLILNSGHNADLASEGLKNFDTWLRNTNVSLAEQNRLLRENTLNKLNEQATKAAEEYSKAQKAFDKINKPGPSIASSGGQGSFSAVAPAQARDPKNNPFYKEAAENLRIAKQSYEGINEYRNKAYLAPVAAFGSQAAGATKAAKAVRDVTKATEEYTRFAAPIQEDQLIKAKDEIYPELAQAIQATEKRQKDLNAAANDNITTFDEATKGQVRFSSVLEKVAIDLEDAASVSRNLSYDVEDIARAINGNDWTSAFAGLARVLLQVETAFKTAKTAQDQFNAVAMVGQVAGSAIGGKGGSALSGAASGLAAGATIGSIIPGVGTAVGAAVGAVIGGLGGLFGGSSAKKKAKAQAAAQAAAEEAQRQDQIAESTYSINLAILQAQGKAEEALAMSRQHELDALGKLSPSLVDLQKQLYAAEDAEKAATKAAEHAAAVQARQDSIQDEIDKLTLSSSDLLAASRAKERAEAVALDPALGALIDKLFGLQDAATAAETATAAAEAQAKAVNDAYTEQQRIAEYLANESLASVTSAYEKQTAAIQGVNDAIGSSVKTLDDMTKSLLAFQNELDLGEGGNGAAGYERAKAALLAASGPNASSDQLRAIPELGKAFLAASEATQSTSIGHARDVALVRAIVGQGLSATQNIASGQGWIAKIMQQQAMGLTGFATGGSFTVGGSGAPDSKMFNLALSPGEMVNVTRPGSNDNSMAAAIRDLAAEVSSLRAELVAIKSNTGATASNTEETHGFLRNGTLSVVQEA